MNTLDNMPRAGWLSWFLKGTLVLVAVILFARLGELQIIKGDYYRDLSDNNRIRHISITAPRGKIIGSDGAQIVGNIPIKKKIVFTKEGFKKSLDVEGASSGDLIEESKRNYFLGAAAGHLTGYLGEVDEEEVNKTDPDCPEKGPRFVGSLTGRGGLEEEYDCLLRGIDGEELIEVDAMGKPIRVLGVRNPVPGTDLNVTINTNLQQKVASIMNSLEIKTSKSVIRPEGRKGAVVVMTPDGKVLAIYSIPSYDPNIFVNKNTKEIAAVVKNPDLPLFNRFLNGLYHPGSTFKIVTSAAALEEKKIDGDFTYNDKGFITLNGYTYGSWYFSEFGKVEGDINLAKAISRSTDTFFYKVGEMIGIENLASWANKFSVDKITGIDLPNETKGLFPDPAWKRQVKGELWFLGDTYNVSIGQGDVEVTPLAANVVTSVIANGGKVCRPYLNAELRSDCKSLNLKPTTLEVILEGMIGACSEGGTAYPFFEFTPKTACKTGTSETGDNDKTHAWFAAFAPIENPKIVVDVIVEKAGQGSEVAAPIAKEIMQYYFGKR